VKTKRLAHWGEEIARNARRLNSDFKDLDLSSYLISPPVNE
jgi:hypothetical protein